MPKNKAKQLGRILLEQGIITEDQLDQGLRRKGQLAKRLGSTLVKLGFLEVSVLSRVLAEQAGTAGCDLFSGRIPGDDLAMLTPAQVRTFCVLPAGLTGQKSHVLTADPHDREVLYIGGICPRHMRVAGDCPRVPDDCRPEKTR